MSDRFLPESAASISGLNEQGCESCGSARPTNTAAACSLCSSPVCPATRTCERYTPEPLSLSMSFAAASRASTSATPADVPGSTDRARVFGPRCSDSLASFNPATSSWRTSQLSLLGEWDASSVTFPRSGMTRSGTAYELRTSGLPISEIGSGSLPIPTPIAGDGRSARNRTSGRRPGSNHHDGVTLSDFVLMFPTPCARDWKGEGFEGQLGTVAASGMWPTPDASVSNIGEDLENWQERRDRELAKGRNGNGFGTPLAVAVRLWPTPKASPSGPDYARSNRETSGGDDLATAVARQDRGQLNPTWVEWLMGFPLGWTDLAPSETP
jgi:hypothetical protein